MYHSTSFEWRCGPNRSRKASGCRVPSHGVGILDGASGAPSLRSVSLCSAPLRFRAPEVMQLFFLGVVTTLNDLLALYGNFEVGALSRIIDTEGIEPRQ